jgi:hypothetical protein
MFKQRSANELHAFRINETFHGRPLQACRHGGTHDARPLEIVGVAIPPLNVTVQRGHEIDRFAAGASALFATTGYNLVSKSIMDCII